MRPQTVAAAVPPRRTPAEEYAIQLSSLLVRVARGDEASFTALHAALRPSVYGVARRVIGDRHRAQDVSQEVFIQVWQSALRFDPSRGSAKTWILTIAHRRAVDAVRHDQAAKNRDTKVYLGNGPDFNPVEEAAEDNESRAEVRACLSKLTKLQRQAIEMAYYDGLTYIQVARVLAVNPSTIKTRMRDGIARLRDGMQSSTPLR